MGAIIKFMENPRRDHWTTMNWILCYLNDTFDVAIFCDGQDLKLVGYVNVDFVRDYDRRRTTIGYVFSLANGTVGWMSMM